MNPEIESLFRNNSNKIEIGDISQREGFDRAEKKKRRHSTSSFTASTDYLSALKANPPTFENQEEYYNRLLQKIGISKNPEVERLKDKVKREHLLEEKAAVIRQLEAEYLEAVKKNMKPYHGYPANDDFSKYREDAKKHALEEDDRTKLVNQAISFLAENVCKQMLPKITKTPEFKEIEKLASGVGNAKKAIKNIETITKQLSQDPGHVQRCWESIKRGFVRQIEVTNQRRIKAEKSIKRYKEAAKQLEEHVKLKGDELNKDGETANKHEGKYEEPVVSDTLGNVRERADNVKNRIEQVEKQEVEVKNRVEQAEKRVGEWDKGKNIGDIQKRYNNAKNEAEQAKREADEAQNDMGIYQDLKKTIEQAQKEALSNRVKDDNTEKNINYADEVKKHIELIKGFNKKIKELNDKYKQKTKDYNEKKIKYDEAKAEYEKAKKEADGAQKNVEQAAKFGINASELCEATNDVHKCAKDLALLYTKYVGYAKEVFQLADAMVTELEKNPEKALAKSRINDEKDRFEAEMKAISEIKGKQEEEIKTLEKQRKIISNCVKLIEKQDKKVESANQGEQDKKKEDSYEVSKQLKEQVENFTAWGREIDKAIDSAHSRLLEIEKQLEGAKKLESQYKALVSGQAKEDLSTEVQAEQAKNLAERYYERAKRSLDRAKQYEENENLLAKSIKKDQESPVSFAKQMAEKEQAIGNAYRDLAYSKGELAKASQGDKDKSSTDDAVEKAENKIKEVNETIKNLLTQLDGLYKNEKDAIDKYEAKIRKYFESAKTDEKKLEGVRKIFEDNKSKNFEGIDGVLKENKSYLENRIEYNIKKAIDKLDAINNRLKEQNVEHITDSSEAHVFIDAANSGFIVINGVVMDMKEIRSFKYDKEKEITTIVWREDLSQVTIFGDKKFTKRLSYFEVNTNNKTVTIGIPGNRYKDGERSKGIVTFKNQDFEGAVIDQEPISQEGQKIEIEQNNQEIKKEYEMGKVKSINITAYEKHKGNIEVGSLVEIKTMPSNVIEHKNPVNCYSREMLQNMHRLNLRKNKYFSPDSEFSLDLGDFDFTETRMDKAKGLSFVQEWTFRMANLEQIAKMSFNRKENMKQIGEDMIMKKREREWNSIENLKWAIRTQNPDVIASTVQCVKKIEGQGEAETYTMLKQIRHLPTDREQLERMNESSDNCVKELVQADWRNVQKAHKARFTLDEELRQHIHAIHEKHPLSLKEVRQYDHEKNSLENHPSSDKKKNLLESIYKAYELDKTYSFQLLVDPNKGGEVKCSTPDALMLLEEYDKYANKKLSKEEKQYIKNIEDFVNNTTNNHYMKNAINLKVALMAVNNGEDLNNVFTALGKLRGGDNVDHDSLQRLKENANSSKEGLEEYLKALRQNDEYHWVSYIDKSIQSAQGINERIYGPLQTVASMQGDRLITLELAKETLRPDTPSDLAIEKLENVSLRHKASLCQQMANVDVQSKEKDSNFKHEAQKIIDKFGEQDPTKYAEKAFRLAWKEAPRAFRKLVESLPNQRKDFEAHSTELIKLMSEQYLKEFNRMLAFKLNKERKEVLYKAWSHDLMATLAMMGFDQLRNFQARLGNLFTRFLADLEKIAGIGI